MKKTKNALILALIIINVSFLSSCKDETVVNTRAIETWNNLGMDENTACFLSISLRPILVSENNIQYHNTVDAYCTDGDANDPKFVDRKYIRCNGDNMRHMYGDSKNVGRYDWGSLTKDPSSIKIEMDYFDEDYVFEHEMFRSIKIIDELPITIDPEKGLKLHYTGGGSGEKMYVSIGYGGNGIGKSFIDDGSGVLEFTPEEVEQLTLLFLDGDDLEAYLKVFEEKYGFRPTAFGYPFYVQRVKKVKEEIKNGKNIFANITQIELEGLLFTFNLKKKK